MDNACDDAYEQSLNDSNLLHLDGGISSVMCAMVDLFFIFNVMYVFCVINAVPAVIANRKEKRRSTGNRLRLGWNAEDCD
jgi:hypothetical protein